MNIMFVGVQVPLRVPSCENSSAGRARPCQGRGRGFESRFSLKLQRPSKRRSFFFSPDGGIGRHAGLKILWTVMSVWVQVPLRVLLKHGTHPSPLRPLFSLNR